MANRTEIKNLQDLIKDSIGGEVVEQTVSSLLPPGENYGSVMYKVDFKVKKDGKEEEYHAVAKCTPLNTVTQEIFNIQETTKAEIAWYTTVIPTLKQFQKDHGVEKEIDFFQRFYGARINLDPNSDRVDLDGVILTQNLKNLGYYNVDRHVGFDLDTTYTILRDLATFHAVPLALRLQNRELFDTNIQPYLPRLKELPKEMQDGFKKHTYGVYNQIPECLTIFDRIKKYVEEVNVFGRPARETSWDTVIHLDFWMNNIMVTGGKESKTIILDFQVPNLGSPAADLAFFLLTSVKLDVVQNNLDDFVEFYYQQFIKNLRELDVSTDNYTFEGLLKEIDTEVKLGEFSHALGHTAVILGEKGQSAIDASDEHFEKGTLLSDGAPKANERQIERYRWIATEAAKRKWI